VSRRSVAALVVTLLPALGLRAQEPATLLPPNVDFSGTWSGSGRFTNEWANPVCRYSGPTVTLEVRQEAQQTGGTLDLEIKASDSPSCPALKKQYTIEEIRVTGSRMSFVDPAGAVWDIALRSGGLLGIVTWRGGPTSEPLAEGFLGPDGTAPLTRLQGEVNLKRQGGSDLPGPRGKPSLSGTTKAIGAIVAAEAVGTAVLLTTNRYTRLSGRATQNSCSQRYCTVGAPCLCLDAQHNISNLVTGGSCGTTDQGGSTGSPCSPPNFPCQAGLSCDSFANTTGICVPDAGQGTQCPLP
jgi:hypothetical protein